MTRMSRRSFTTLVAGAALAPVAISAAALPANAGGTVAGVAHQTPDSRVKPTIVLVHGAFADSSGWSLLSAGLQARGYPVIAFSNPLRGPLYDGEYLRGFLSTIAGPIVLVGHSYGGAVISTGATDNPNVKSLVFIAAYALAAGESVQAANALGGGHSDVTDHLVLRPFPGAAAGDADASIDPAHFPRLFAQDLPKAVARNLAGSQRPGALASLVTPSGPPAWASIPSWYMIASNDRIIPPEAEKAMAERAGSKVVTVDSSHVPMISQPRKVIALVLDAAR